MQISPQNWPSLFAISDGRFWSKKGLRVTSYHSNLHLDVRYAIVDICCNGFFLRRFLVGWSHDTAIPEHVYWPMLASINRQYKSWSDWYLGLINNDSTVHPSLKSRGQWICDIFRKIMFAKWVTLQMERCYDFFSHRFFYGQASPMLE